MQFLFIALLPFLSLTAEAVERGSVEPSSVKTVAFGSCNRQNKPQTHWGTIKTKGPELFIWTGDSVYSKYYTIESLEGAYQNLTGNHLYRSFVGSTEIRGVWDDHDYGVNDGGRMVSDIASRQRLFERNILGKELSSSASTDSSRVGLHTVFEKKFADSGSVAKFILLDTRTFRDNHYIRSIGEFKFPLTPLIAAALRAAYSIVGFGRNYAGDVLGEDQWQWLESTLQDSKADFHIIVSSIQVFTSNPVVESWGHFPESRKRLLNLLKKHDPRGTVFISGDVHHGELSRASVLRSNGAREDLVEVTSSGLTHTCGDSLMNRVLCPLMLYIFSANRLPSEHVSKDTERDKKKAFLDSGNVFIGRNFGLITDVTTSEQTAAQCSAGDKSCPASASASLNSRFLKFSIMSVDSGEEMLSYTVESKTKSSATSGSTPIEAVEIADFPSLMAYLRLSEQEFLIVCGTVVTFIATMIWIDAYFTR